MKKLIIGVVVVIVVIVAALIVVPFFIPVDTYKGKVIALVKDETGRDLRIDGPISFSLLPSIALEANNVSFSNPPGASTPNMMQLKTLDVKLKLAPLLHGAIAVDEFKLVDPTIDLEVDKAGRPNWTFEAPAKPGAAPAPAAPAQPPPAAQPPATAQAPAASSGGELSSLSLGDVSIVNGQATYLDQRDGQKQVVSEVNMQLSLPSLAGPFNAKGSAVWNGEKVSLTLAMDNPGKLQTGGSSAVGITIASSPLNFDFKGNATGATLAKLTGITNVAVPSVRGLAKWVGSTFSAPGTGFGALSIKGNFDKEGSKIAFTDASLSLDQINATGALTLDTSGARPHLTGRLDADKLDVNPYLPPETPAGSAAPSAPAAAPGAAKPAPAPAASSGGNGWSDAPLDLSPLKAADVDFDVSANSILYRKIQIGKSALATHLKDGRFEADLSDMELYQGKGTGKVVADGSQATPAIAATFNLSGVAVQPLARDAANFERLTGTGAVTLDVTGRGASERAIIGALNGKGSFDLANGKIEGVNLIAFMKNVASSVGGGVGGSNETDFGSLTGTYTITNGILHNNDLKLTSPEIPMTGAGTVDLPQRQVDYKLTPSVAGLLAFPVNITGPWDDLSYRPDLTGMAKGLAQDPGKALDVLKNQGSNAGSGTGNLLKGLLGR